MSIEVTVKVFAMCKILTKLFLNVAPSLIKIWNEHFLSIENSKVVTKRKKHVAPLIGIKIRHFDPFNSSIFLGLSINMSKPEFFSTDVSEHRNECHCLNWFSEIQSCKFCSDCAIVGNSLNGRNLSQSWS